MKYDNLLFCIFLFYIYLVIKKISFKYIYNMDNNLMMYALIFAVFYFLFLKK